MALSVAGLFAVYPYVSFEELHQQPASQPHTHTHTRTAIHGAAPLPRNHLRDMTHYMTHSHTWQASQCLPWRESDDQAFLSAKEPSISATFHQVSVNGTCKLIHMDTYIYTYVYIHTYIKMYVHTYI